MSNLAIKYKQWGGKCNMAHGVTKKWRSWWFISNNLRRSRVSFGKAYYECWIDSWWSGHDQDIGGCHALARRRCSWNLSSLFFVHHGRFLDHCAFPDVIYKAITLRIISATHEDWHQEDRAKLFTRMVVSWINPPQLFQRHRKYILSDWPDGNTEAAW